LKAEECVFIIEVTERKRYCDEGVLMRARSEDSIGCELRVSTRAGGKRWGRGEGWQSLARGAWRVYLVYGVLMQAFLLKAADPRLQMAKAQTFEHGVVCPARHNLFPGGKDLGGAAVHHTSEGGDNGMEGTAACRTMPDLVIGKGTCGAAGMGRCPDSGALWHGIRELTRPSPGLTDHLLTHDNNRLG
jgi:hypothetical protein